MNNQLQVDFTMVNGKNFTFFFNDQIDELLRKIEFDQNNSFIKAADGTYLMIKQIASFKVVELNV